MQQFKLHQHLGGFAIVILVVLAAGALTTQHLALETAESICAPNAVKSSHTSALGLSIQCSASPAGSRR